ncbi:hypothetical protein [Vibrio sp. 10N]|uniref:hypothetical protein n=1 Tax=Vibrio sp. 10N TaxID=3058938 RepID=UPI0030C69A6E
MNIKRLNSPVTSSYTANAGVIRTQQPSHFLTVDEKTQRLIKAPAIYFWTVTPPRYKWLWVTEAVISLICTTVSLIIVLSQIMEAKEVHWYGAGVFFFGGNALALYFRYAVHKPSTYHYELTHYGVRMTIKCNVNEAFYSAIRISGWIGCVVCIAAFLVIGPLAFAGAAAGALMAPKFTKVRKVTRHDAFLIDSNINFKYLRRDWNISTNPRCDDGSDFNAYLAHRSRYEFYIQPRKLYQLITYIKLATNVVEFREVYTLDDLRE